MSDTDAFRAAAVSWVGAPLDDMVKVWGEPNRRIIDAEPGRNGLVRWQSSKGRGGVQGGKVDHLCSVEARFDINRTVTRVDTIAQNCDKRYVDEIYALTRRAE